MGGSLRFVPRGLRTATGAGDERPQGRGRELAPILARSFSRRQGNGLPPDILAVLGRPGTHWTGNVHVSLGRRSVERHTAQALRVRPGRTNVTFFCMGGSIGDSYRLHVEAHPDWECELYGERRVIEQGTWIDGSVAPIVFVAMRPPESCATGALDVCVEQRSTGRTTRVEFSLDAEAAKPGCYVL